MKDFIIAALPWIIIGISIALFIALHTKKKKPRKINLTRQALI